MWVNWAMSRLEDLVKSRLEDLATSTLALNIQVALVHTPCYSCH
jgi:hypothetical protein